MASLGRPSSPASALAEVARGVVFDKDGTLFDLDARWLPYFQSFVAGVAERSGDPSLAPVLADLLGIGHERLLPGLPAAVETGAHIRDIVVGELVGRGRSLTAMEALVAEAEGAASIGPLAALGDVVAAVQALVGGGRRIGIATSDGRRNTVVELTEFAIMPMVDTMRCGDDDGPVKPDPGVLWSIAEEWGLEPSALLYVGDSRHDLLTARAAGVPFVAVARAEREPWPDDPGDARVHSIDELVD